MRTREVLSGIMTQAWVFVKRNGMSMSEALTKAWANYKLLTAMHLKIVRFYFQKVDGSLREAYGTLNAKYMPEMTGESSNRKKNDTVQTYFDTERQEFRCFKKANLVRIA